MDAPRQSDLTNSSISTIDNRRCLDNNTTSKQYEVTFGGANNFIPFRRDNNGS